MFTNSYSCSRLRSTFQFFWGVMLLTFLLFNGHVLKGVLTSGEWRELVVSDCFLGTGQEGEFCIAQCNSFLKN